MLEISIQYNAELNYKILKQSREFICQIQIGLTTVCGLAPEIKFSNSA